MDTYTVLPAGSVAVPPMADMTTSMDISQPATHVPSRPSSTASTSRPGSVASGSVTASRSRLARPLLTSSNSTELIPPPASEEGNGSVRAVPMVGGSGEAKGVPSNDLDGAGKMSTGASVELSSAPNLRSDSNALRITRPSIIGAMKPKRGPSAPQGPRRVTRSVSMKEQSVKDGLAETEDTMVISHTVEGKGHKCGLLILITSTNDVCQCLLRSQPLPWERRLN